MVQVAGDVSLPPVPSRTRPSQILALQPSDSQNVALLYESSPTGLQTVPLWFGCWHPAQQSPPHHVPSLPGAFSTGRPLHPYKHLSLVPAASLPTLQAPGPTVAWSVGPRCPGLSLQGLPMSRTGPDPHSSAAPPWAQALTKVTWDFFGGLDLPDGAWQATQGCTFFPTVPTVPCDTRTAPCPLPLPWAFCTQTL